VAPGWGLPSLWLCLDVRVRGCGRSCVRQADQDVTRSLGPSRMQSLRFAASVPGHVELIPFGLGTSVLMGHFIFFKKFSHFSGNHIVFMRN